MVIRLFVLVLLSWLTAHPALAASFSASVDRTRISEQETLTLSLRYEAQVLFQKPDLTARPPPPSGCGSAPPRPR